MKRATAMVWLALGVGAALIVMLKIGVGERVGTAGDGEPSAMSGDGASMPADAVRVDARPADAGASVALPSSNHNTQPGDASNRMVSAVASTGGRTGLGLQPLTMAQEQRLETFVDALAEHHPSVRDFESLAQQEQKDPDWSAEVESLLANAMLRHGAHLTVLHAGPPYCTRSICRMVATGGLDTSAANADWQGLMSKIMGEPWFAEHFVDASTTLQGGPEGVLYVTYFVRGN